MSQRTPYYRYDQYCLPLPATFRCQHCRYTSTGEPPVCQPCRERTVIDYRAMGDRQKPTRQAYVKLADVEYLASLYDQSRERCAP